MLQYIFVIFFLLYTRNFLHTGFLVVHTLIYFLSSQSLMVMSLMIFALVCCKLSILHFGSYIILELMFFFFIVGLSFFFKKAIKPEYFFSNYWIIIRCSVSFIEVVYWFLRLINFISVFYVKM